MVIFCVNHLNCADNPNYSIMALIMPELGAFEKYSDPNLTKLSQQQVEKNRALVSKIVRIVCPTEIYTRENTVSKLDQLIDAGYSVLELYNHFCEDDPFRTVAAAFKLWPDLLKKPVYTPLEYYLFNRIVRYTDACGIAARGIVTEDTIAKRGNIIEVIDDSGASEFVTLPQNFGGREYIEEAGEILSNQGMVFMAPQQGRRPTLELTDKRPVEFVLRKTEKDAKVAILFAGLGFKNESNYEHKDYSGLNIGRKLKAVFGPVLTRQELTDEAKKLNMTIDQYCLWQLGQNVPTVYNHIPDPTPHSPPSQV